MQTKRHFERRSFLTAAAAAAALTAVSGLTSADDDSAAKRQFTSIQKYTVKDLEKRQQLVDFFGKCLIPALNAGGIKGIGIFIPMEKEEKYQLNVFVVIPHASPASFLSMRQQLLADSGFRKNGAALFDTNSKNPLFTDCTAALLWNFAYMPVIETHNLGKDRVFQLRRYRSFNLERHNAKMDMFEAGGELRIFRETGLNPIFFGDTLFGNKLPNLAYMIGCENMEAHDAAWKKFIAHPDWIVLKGNPKYADTATEIDKVMLRPSAESQI